jgi:Zn ribbon nucleic-acid-binding protein
MITPCPHCKTNANVYLIETTTMEYVHGIAVECAGCGMRSVAVDQDAGDDAAMNEWNKMAKNLAAATVQEWIVRHGR